MLIRSPNSGANIYIVYLHIAYKQTCHQNYNIYNHRLVTTDWYGLDPAHELASRQRVRDVRRVQIPKKEVRRSRERFGHECGRLHSGSHIFERIEGAFATNAPSYPQTGDMGDGAQGKEAWLPGWDPQRLHVLSVLLRPKLPNPLALSAVQ